MQELVQLRTRNSKTFDLENGQYRVETTIHSQHYHNGVDWQDVNTDWEYEEGFGYKVQKAKYKLRHFDQTLRFGFSEGVYVDYILPQKLVTFLGSQGYYDIPAFGIRMQYTATPDGMKFEAVLGKKISNRDYTFPIILTNCTASVENNSLIYRDLQGNVIGAIPTPYMIDANNEVGIVTLGFDGTKVTLTPDYNWLKNATYPVKIDPSTTIQVNNGQDDGFIDATNFYNSSSPPFMVLGVYASSDSTFARFTGVTVPKNATINSAKIQYNAYQAITFAPLTTRIFFNDVDNAVAPMANSDYKDKVTTTAYVDWSIPAQSAGAWFDSPDIKTVVQEIVNRTGWASGNAMMLLHKDNGSGSNYGYLSAYESSGGTTAPKLVIDYSTGGGGTSVTVSAVTSIATSTSIAPTVSAKRVISVSSVVATSSSNAKTPTISAIRNINISSVVATVTSNMVVPTIAILFSSPTLTVQQIGNYIHLSWEVV